MKSTQFRPDGAQTCVFLATDRWRDTGLSYEIRSAFTFGAEIQNLRVLVVIGDRAHHLFIHRSLNVEIREMWMGKSAASKRTPLTS